MPTLEHIFSEKPFPDYADWWQMGGLFTRFMSKAIVPEWRALPYNPGHLHQVQTFAEQYIRAVFGRKARETLVSGFCRQLPHPYLSGEFDALSYAFFRSAFELMEKHVSDHTRPRARRGIQRDGVLEATCGAGMLGTRKLLFNAASVGGSRS